MGKCWKEEKYFRDDVLKRANLVRTPWVTRIWVTLGDWQTADYSQMGQREFRKRFSSAQSETGRADTTRLAVLFPRPEARPSSSSSSSDTRCDASYGCNLYRKKNVKNNEKEVWSKKSLDNNPASVNITLNLEKDEGKHGYEYITFGAGTVCGSRNLSWMEMIFNRLRKKKPKWTSLYDLKPAIRWC